VVHELEDHVVQPRDVVGVSDVHPGPLAHGLQALQELDRVGRVGGRAHPCLTSASPPSTARGLSTIRPPRISTTASAFPPQRPGSEAVVKRTVSAGGSASRNASTHPSERPASNSSTAKRGASSDAFAIARHSASLTRAIVLVSSPAEAVSASGLPPRSQSRSS